MTSSHLGLGKHIGASEASSGVAQSSWQSFVASIRHKALTSGATQSQFLWDFMSGVVITAQEWITAASTRTRWEVFSPNCLSHLPTTLLFPTSWPHLSLEKPPFIKDETKGICGLAGLERIALQHLERRHYKSIKSYQCLFLSKCTCTFYLRLRVPCGKVETVDYVTIADWAEAKQQCKLMLMCLYCIFVLLDGHLIT